MTDVIFSKNIIAESNVTLPIKSKALCDLGFQPGASVKWRDICFSADEVERLTLKTFIQVKTEVNLLDLKLEEIVTLKSKIESLVVQIEELTQKKHSNR
ncbi:MAG: hypothetical protein ACN6NJ_08965 [Acinetobacter sp.]